MSEQAHYTDLQLQRFLASCLTEKLIHGGESNQEDCVRWKDGWGTPVKPTQWLQIVWEVEEGLTEAQRMRYADLVQDNTRQDLVDYSGCYYLGDYPSIDLGVLYNMLHATWQQRTIALAQALGRRITE